ncbi:Lrp/AsnC family transcriptional regulator [Halobacteriaceae archaeon GCM10025711]
MEDSRAVLDLLLENARYSNDDIARQTGLTADEVAAVVADLEARGVVRGYQAVVDWDRVDEEHIQAEVELNVELDRETSYADIARRIAKFPQVASLRLVSGDYDFAVDVVGSSMQETSNFVAEQIAPIPEVTQTVTHYVMETYKERGIELDDDSDDDRLSVSP